VKREEFPHSSDVGDSEMQDSQGEQHLQQFFELAYTNLFACSNGVGSQVDDKDECRKALVVTTVKPEELDLSKFVSTMVKQYDWWMDAKRPHDQPQKVQFVGVDKAFYKLWHALGAWFMIFMKVWINCFMPQIENRT